MPRHLDAQACIVNAMSGGEAVGYSIDHKFFGPFIGFAAITIFFSAIAILVRSLQSKYERCSGPSPTCLQADESTANFLGDRAKRDRDSILNSYGSIYSGVGSDTLLSSREINNILSSVTDEDYSYAKLMLESVDYDYNKLLESDLNAKLHTY